MAEKRTFNIILSIIVFVVLVMVIVIVFVSPSQKVYEEEGKPKLTDLLEISADPDYETVISMQITESDSTEEKIRKIFENFNPNLIHHIDADKNRYYNKIIIVNGEDLGVSDVYNFDGILIERGIYSIIKDALIDWDEDENNDEFEFDCDTIDIEWNQLNVLGYRDTDTCWVNSNMLTGCKIYWNRYAGFDHINEVLKGDKTIRIMWKYVSEGKVKPIIAICGEY